MYSGRYECNSNHIWIEMLVASMSVCPMTVIIFWWLAVIDLHHVLPILGSH